MNKTNKTLLDIRRKSVDKENKLDKSKQEEKEKNLKRQTGKGQQVHHSEKLPVFSLSPPQDIKKYFNTFGGKTSKREYLKFLYSLALCFIIIRFCFGIEFEFRKDKCLCT